MANEHPTADQQLPRVVCWFSCGDASAVATALAIKEFGSIHEVVVARICIDSEHPDNDRFAAECSKWFCVPITNLRSDEYKDTWDVWETRKYIAGIQGAPCTGLLKKAVRYKFQRHDDIHVFGYTDEPRERLRYKNLKENNFELDTRAPLISASLRKEDCHALVQAAGIELPMMYRLGFGNNNCIGCPKGGAGYWNKIRIHFLPIFLRMCELSRRLGVRLVKQDGKRIFLDELRPETGRQKNEAEISCSSFCEDAAEVL